MGIVAFVTSFLSSGGHCRICEQRFRILSDSDSPGHFHRKEAPDDIAVATEVNEHHCQRHVFDSSLDERRTNSNGNISRVGVGYLLNNGSCLFRYGSFRTGTETKTDRKPQGLLIDQAQWLSTANWQIHSSFELSPNI